MPSESAISARTRVAAVLGWPVGHSRSPALHNAAYRAAGIDAIYVALAVPPGRVGEALVGIRALGFLGVNVTVPHKDEALARCDELDDVARAVGAVNTIVPDDRGRLVGTNTDVAGFAESLTEALAGERPARAVVLGAGGAARAVVAALRSLGVEVVAVARDAARARPLVALGATIAPWTRDALDALLPEARLLVDATSAALSAEDERAVPADVPVARLPTGALVCSLVYHREPALLGRARAAGLRTLDGAGMLVHQAAHAFTRMTGRPAPLDAMWAAFRGA